MTQLVKGYSDPVASPDGMITCTIEHVEFGSIPYTYCPKQKDALSLEVGALLKADGIKRSALKKCPTIAEFAAMDGRIWRNAELKRADVIINKIEDFEIEGDSKEWRKYRVALRNWPEVKGFPAEKSRPVAPDAEKSE